MYCMNSHWVVAGGVIMIHDTYVRIALRAYYFSVGTVRARVCPTNERAVTDVEESVRDPDASYSCLTV